MAPCSSTMDLYHCALGSYHTSEDSMSPPKPKTKLRKPIVEKMRRDRINSSIEKLKVLLAKEFRGQDAGGKLEKADILEAAVDYLTRQKTGTSGQSPPQHDYREGFSQCLREAVVFLSRHSVTPEAQMKLLSHFQVTPPGAVQKEPGLSPSGGAYPTFQATTAAAIKQEAATPAPTEVWRPW